MSKTNQGYLITQERLSSARANKVGTKLQRATEGGSEQLAKPLHSKMDHAGKGRKLRKLLATPAKQSTGRREICKPGDPRSTASTLQGETSLEATETKTVLSSPLLRLLLCVAGARIPSRSSGQSLIPSSHRTPCSEGREQLTLFTGHCTHSLARSEMAGAHSSSC